MGVFFVFFVFLNFFYNLKFKRKEVRNKCKFKNWYRQKKEKEIKSKLLTPKVKIDQWYYVQKNYWTTPKGYLKKREKNNQLIMIISIAHIYIMCYIYGGRVLHIRERVSRYTQWRHRNQHGMVTVSCHCSKWVSIALNKNLNIETIQLQMRLGWRLFIRAFNDKLFASSILADFALEVTVIWRGLTKVLWTGIKIKANSLIRRDKALYVLPGLL